MDKYTITNEQMDAGLNQEAARLGPIIGLFVSLALRSWATDHGRDLVDPEVAMAWIQGYCRGMQRRFRVPLAEALAEQASVKLSAEDYRRLV